MMLTSSPLADGLFSSLCVISAILVLYYVYTGCGKLTSFFEYEMPYEKGS
jgi:hypothetical protein